MELFEFCMEIIKREGEKFNVAVNTYVASQITAATAADVNYDIAHNRCAFLYRCGAINLYFARDCFSKFLTEYKSLMFLVSKWINSPNLTLCSISKGPALDYISFLLSCQESKIFPSFFKNIKLVSKYGAWRNTTNIMHQLISEGHLKGLPISMQIGTIEVIQGDPFKEFTQKVKDPISNSDVVLMMKTLNLQADGCIGKNITESLQEFLGALKPGAVLFCIDTKPSIAVITQLLSTFEGKLLFAPTYINTIINLEYAEFYKNLFGCLPVLSGRGSFFVWQKSTNFECLVDEVSQSVKCLLKVNTISDMNGSSETAASGTSSSNFEWSNTANSTESKSSNQNSVDSVKIGIQNSKYFSSCSSLPIELLTSDNTKNQRQSMQSASSQPMLSYSSANECTQTEEQKSLNGTEPSRIMQLINRIANLTMDISKILEKTEYSNHNHCHNSEELCKHDAFNDCTQTCSSEISCLHRHQCSNVSACCAPNNCTMYNCCENNTHLQSNLTSNQCNSSASLCNCEGFSCNTASKISIKNNCSVPQLVIPLNSLPVDSISQIISLLTESNLDCKVKMENSSTN